MSIDPGEGYLQDNDRQDEVVLLLRLTDELYGERAPEVVARALRFRGHSSTLAGALLHRVLEETTATLSDLQALPPSTRSLVDALNARAGERPTATAARCALNEAAVELLIGYDTAARPRPSSVGDRWWPTDPAAYDVLQAAYTAQVARREAEQSASQMHWSLPKDPEFHEHVPVTWANAVQETYDAFVTRGDSHGTRRGRFYEGRRLRGFHLPQGFADQGARHLRDCYEAGMSPELYADYVQGTSLTWTQFPDWGRLGLSARAVNQVLVLFGLKMPAWQRAVSIAGGERQALALGQSIVALLRHVGQDEEREMRRRLGGLGMYETVVLDRRVAVDGAMEVLAERVGEGARVERWLGLWSRLHEGDGAKQWLGVWSQSDPGRPSDWSRAQAWFDTGLPLERVLLLLGAGVDDPEQATAPETVALTEAQLQMAAMMGR